MTPLKAIRAKCLDCCGYQIAEVRRCPAKKCPLHEYRMGHNPARAKKHTTPEQEEENPGSTTDF